MSRLDQLTRFHGKLSDLKVTWWPFLFLKPSSATVPLTWNRLALMVPCFAAWLLLGWLLRAVVVGDFQTLDFSSVARAYFYLLLAFTLWFSLVTAPLWNRRARLINETATPQPA